jgi:hypothetical protein
MDSGIKENFRLGNFSPAHTTFFPRDRKGLQGRQTYSFKQVVSFTPEIILKLLFIIQL